MNNKKEQSRKIILDGTGKASLSVTDRANHFNISIIERGRRGVSLNFHWDGTKLGVKRDLDTEYQYVDLGLKWDNLTQSQKNLFIDKALEEWQRARDMYDELSPLVDHFVEISSQIDASAALAKQWANEDEDVVVKDNEYSAKHYSRKSSNSATQAAQSQQAALQSEQQAEQSRQAALQSEQQAELHSNEAKGAEQSAKAHSDDALEYKDQAKQYRNTTRAYRDDAQGLLQQTIDHEQGADQSRSEARRWANEDEDVVVKDNEYSAKHYAQKGQQAYDRTEQAKDAAVQSEQNARQSEQDASSHESFARRWATENEDVVVRGGEYSARHHALKSKASALQSENSSTQSKSARDEARLWAVEDVDKEVQPGEYSARHYAIKSIDSANSAFISEQSAEQSRDTAQAHRDASKSYSEQAEESKDWAQRWANEAEDIEVLDNEYSAKHYAIKAEAIRDYLINTFQNPNIEWDDQTKTFIITKNEGDVEEIDLSDVVLLSNDEGNRLYYKSDGLYTALPTASELGLGNVEDGAQVNVQSDWDESDDQSDAFIKNKPHIPQGTVTKIEIVTDADSGLEVLNGEISESGVIEITVKDTHAIPTTTQQSQWTEAHGWGDHSQAGYALDSQLHDVAKTGDYNSLENTPTALSEFDNDEAYISAVSTQQSNSIEFGGQGTDADSLTATVRVSEDTGNKLITKTDGLYVEVPTLEELGLDKVEDGAQVNVQSDWNEGDEQSDAFIKNKPHIPQGTVTSVKLKAPEGMTVSGSPITESGELTLNYAEGYELPDAVQKQKWDDAYSWGNHADFGYGVVGSGENEVRSNKDLDIRYIKGGELVSGSGDSEQDVIHQLGIKQLLSLKVDKVDGKGLSDENFSAEEKQKLASLESSKYKGQYTSLDSLKSAIQNPQAGDYADVDEGEFSPIVRFVYDETDNEWIMQQGESTSLTGSQIKALYESQPNTNAFTDDEKDRLSQTVLLDDARLENAREWTAETISYDEAVGGESETRRAWTSKRVREATEWWWNQQTTQFVRETLQSSYDLYDFRNALELKSSIDFDVGREIGQIPTVGEFGMGSYGVLESGVPEVFDRVAFYHDAMYDEDNQQYGSNNTYLNVQANNEFGYKLFSKPGSDTLFVNVYDEGTEQGERQLLHTNNVQQGKGDSTFFPVSQQAFTQQVEQLEDEKASKSISITGTGGLSGGGDLSNSRTLDLSSATKASLAKADSAVQPDREIIVGSGLTGGGDLATDVSIGADFGNSAGTVTEGNDVRLSNSREWTASTVSQTEAEAGTATTRRAWTAQRVRQAIVSWWQSATSAFGRELVEKESASQVRSYIGLGNVDNTADMDKPVSNAVQAALDKKIDSSPEEDGPALKWAELDDLGHFFGMEDEGGFLSGLVASTPGETFIVLEGQANQYSQLTPYSLSFAIPSLNRVASIGAEGVLKLVEGDYFSGTYLPFRYSNQLELSQINDPSHIPNKEYVDSAVANKADKTELFSGSYMDLTDRPSSGSKEDLESGSSSTAVLFAPKTLSEWIAEKGYVTSVEAGVSAPVQSVAGKTGNISLTKNDVGLSNVNNTSDDDKPISNATQAALDGKVNTDDSRLTNSREWTAGTVSQAEAEAGTATTRRAWTAQRVRQAITAWFNGVSTSFTRTLLGRSNASQVRSDLELGTAATFDSGFSGGLVATSARTAERVSYSGTSSEPTVSYSFGGTTGGWARGIMTANLAGDTQRYGGFWFGLLGNADNYTRGIIGFGNDSNWWQTNYQISLYPNEDPTVGTSNTIFHMGNILKTTGNNDNFPMSQKAVTDALNTKITGGSVVQGTGSSTTNVMSQKAVTDALNSVQFGDMDFGSIA